MSSLLQVTAWVLASAIGFGCCIWLAAGVSALRFRVRRRRLARTPASTFTPAVSVLKPVYGLEKELRENLRSACTQDYPSYQVVFSVQRRDDPALELLLSLQSELGAERVTVAVEEAHVGANGKINNLVGALPYAKHDVLVISDSDVRLAPDYLRRMVAPLADPDVGAVSSFFRAVRVQRWFERFELLTINADHMPLAMLGEQLGIGDICLGASCALTRRTLDAIGGFAVLGDYLVEDNELGRRIARSGGRLEVIAYVVDTLVDQASLAGCWQKQIYWDQNTRAAIPGVFAASLPMRVIPLSLLYAVLTQQTQAWSVVGAAFACRLGAAALSLAAALEDREGLASLWLLPLKDCLSLYWFARAWLKRSVIWRGVEMRLTPDGQLRPLPPAHAVAREERAT